VLIWNAGTLNINCFRIEAWTGVVTPGKRIALDAIKVVLPH
jgi:hypothetical protein